LLASLTLKEPLPPSRSLGLALIVCGALAIGGIGITSTSSRQSIGHLCFLGAACLWAYYTVAVRRARIDGLHAAAIAAVASLLCYLPIYLLLCGDRLLQVPLIDIIVQAFYQGDLTAVISLALYGRAVSLIGASSAGAFIALGPVIAAIIGDTVSGRVANDHRLVSHLDHHRWRLFRQPRAVAVASGQHLSATWWRARSDASWGCCVA
jgi:drug/metabolite transporter (DMT)-like permease